MDYPYCVIFGIPITETFSGIASRRHFSGLFTATFFGMVILRGAARARAARRTPRPQV